MNLNWSVTKGTSCSSEQGGDADASSKWEGDGVRFYYANQRGVQFKAQGERERENKHLCTVCACVLMCVILDIKLEASQMLEDTAPLLSSIPALCVIFTWRHRLLSCPGCPELVAQTDFELDPPASAFQVGGAGLCPQTSSV